MISEERLRELIGHYEMQLSQISAVADMFGLGDNPIMEMTQNIANKLTIDTITALKEYVDMLSVRKMIDGG